jgi:ribosomal peptide maturation radical SAM protein 1
VENLDAQPDPDYADYFEQYQTVLPRLDGAYTPHLLFESSRGCWWGEVSHCTFCGLNGSSMRFRSKAATRALQELERMTGAHPGSPAAVVDNIIDNRYFHDFVPMLAARGLGLNLFYEVKANLRREQVRLLQSAGIRTIQPGIESLDSRVLALMGKGVRAIANVQLLKYCREEGVLPQWNLLWGFPREPEDAFERMAALVPDLVHLQPPVGGSPIRLDRFSPNFRNAARHGITRVRPAPAYALVYGLDTAEVTDLAYYFEFDYERPRDVAAEARRLEEAIATWRRDHDEALLFFQPLGETTLVWDTRPRAARTLHVLTGPAHRILRESADMTSIGRLAERTGDDAETIESAVATLSGAGLLLREGNAVLSLAVALGRWAPGPGALRQFTRAVQALGKQSDGKVIIELSEPVEVPVHSATPHPFKLSCGDFRLLGPRTLSVNVGRLKRLEWTRAQWLLSGLPLPSE